MLQETFWFLFFFQTVYNPKHNPERHFGDVLGAQVSSGIDERLFPGNVVW